MNLNGSLSKCIMTSSRRANIIGLFLISIVCILLLLSTNTNNSNHSSPSYITAENNRFNNVPAPSEWSPKKYQYLSDPNGNADQQQPPRIGPLKRIAEVLAEQREFLDAELIGFPFPDKTALANYTMETGGQPIRSVVITTWRSGSTFLGDILNTLPGNYYHYEPLLDFDIVQVRDEPLASKAIRNLKHLLHCDYARMEQYLEFGEEHTYLFKHNTRLWRQCLDHPHLCWRPRFLSPFCKLFPWQSMKVVRLRLAIAARLLEDDRSVRLSQYSNLQKVNWNNGIKLGSRRI